MSRNRSTRVRTSLAALALLTRPMNGRVILINDANAEGKLIGVVAQINEADEEPTSNDVHKIGTVARILRVLKMPDGNVTVILQGTKRFEINEFVW